MKIPDNDSRENTSVARTGAGAKDAGGTPLVRLRGVKTEFHLEEGVARAVRGLDLDIPRAETIGLVGESGCGKSVTALTLLRLIPEPPGRIEADVIEYDGIDLLALSESEMRGIRGNRISMVFQEPMSSLNPVFTVGSQVAEGLRRHLRVSRAEARAQTVELFHAVGIPNADQRVDAYPHQMSGGMRQRVVIAMALACRPGLLIADEPTTALDVTIQAQILALLERLQTEFGMSVLLITHDLGVVARVTRHVAVMYAGRVVEQSGTLELFRRPLHPYTIGLFKSIPRLGATRQRLEVIPGNVPSPLAQPSGCAFHPRCPHAMEVCQRENPAMADYGHDHRAACHWQTRNPSTPNPGN